jgi:large subunit ribosomal protein L19
MINSTIENVEKNYLKQENVPQFHIGDTVDVHTRIIEGEKERVQIFSGTVIMRRGRGINETFTVRRIVNNEGVERIFPTHSPFIAKLVVKRGGESRRAKLFYLRDRVGKAVRLVEKRKAGKRGDDGSADASSAEPGASTSSKVEAGELAASAAS